MLRTIFPFLEGIRSVGHRNRGIDTILAAPDRETLNEFLTNRKPKIRLDFLLEDEAKKKLTREECEVLLTAIGKKIRRLAVEYFL